MCLNGFWGSVCGEGWDYVDAEIVCHQLGYDGRENIPYVILSEIKSYNFCSQQHIPS